MSDNVKAMLIRLGRILLAQGISLAITKWGGLNVPIINISVGALISAGAKYLRDKFGWTWLPV